MRLWRFLHTYLWSYVRPSKSPGNKVPYRVHLARHKAHCKRGWHLCPLKGSSALVTSRHTCTYLLPFLLLFFSNDYQTTLCLSFKHLWGVSCTPCGFQSYLHLWPIPSAVPFSALLLLYLWSARLQVSMRVALGGACRFMCVVWWIHVV